MIRNWLVEKQYHDQRLKTFIKVCLPEETIRSISWLLDHHRCRINGCIERYGSYRIQAGDLLEIDLTPSKKGEILHEDDDIIIYNKSPYMTSEKLARLLGCLLVHRLDRDTSGVMILAKNLKVKTLLENLFRRRTVRKEYLAIVTKKPQEHAGKITTPIQKKSAETGKTQLLSAETRWEYVEQKNALTLLRCFPITGRTHQIRIHLQSIGHPVYGDALYGKGRSQKACRPLLHASKISFYHPIQQTLYTFKAPLPEDFTAIFGQID